MKHIKMMGLAAVAAMALTAFAASSASATTLEVGGVTQNGPVTITASLQPGTTLLIKDTAGFAFNTCTSVHTHGTTTAPYTGHTVTGHHSTTSLSLCTRPITVHNPGKFEITHIPSTTNGTVYSEEKQTTVRSPIGTLNCTTGATTHIGTLTGVFSGHATIHMNAVINCGIIPSSKWEGTLTVTSPNGLGVSA